MTSKVYKSYPVAPFDRYMLLDSSDNYSMTCHIRTWFDGELIESSFTEALRLTLLQHPLMSSKLHQRIGTFGRTSYHFDEVPLEINDLLDWGDDSAPIPAALLTAPNIHSSYHVRVGNNRSLLVVRFHHAISDGEGIFSFLDDLFRIYDALALKKPIPEITRDMSILKKRFNFGLTPKLWAQRLHLDLRRFFKFIGRLPTPMAPTRSADQSEPSSSEAGVRIVIPKEKLQSLIATARKLDGSVNDVLIAKLFRRLIDWNKSVVGSVKPRSIFRISIPTSLRTKVDENGPAANLVSMVFLDRSTQEILNESRLVHSITKEMKQVKKDRMGLTLIRVVMAMSKFNLFGAFLKIPMCMASIGLTNLGRPFGDSLLKGEDGVIRVGNTIMSGVDTIPPIRNLTRALLSVNRFNEDLSITMRWDSRTINELDARQFLKGYVTSLTDMKENDAFAALIDKTKPALAVEDWIREIPARS